MLPLRKIENRVLTCWEPETDLYRANGKWLVKVNIAGVDPQEIQIDSEHNVLRISGTRKDVTPKFGFIPEEIGISYSRFFKEVVFPKTIGIQKDGIKYENGMLFISIITSF